MDEFDITPKYEEKEEGVSPGVIRLFAADYMELPHQEALDKLEQTYSSLTFSDPTEAAKQYAQAADSIHRLHKVFPESNLGYVFGDTLNYLFNEYAPEEEKLARIDEDYQKAVDNIYADPKNAKGLQSARQLERELDAIRMQLKRGIIAKDVGRMKDLIARGAEAALSPFAGTVDALAGSDYRADLREYVANSTNPEYDESLFSVGANVVGQISGIVASGIAGGGIGAYGYLGAMLTNQSKEVYDTTFAETKDANVAESAMYASMPWNVLGATGDRFLGGIASKVIKGEKGAAGAIKAAVIGGGVEATQEYGVGSVLAEYTSNPAFEATKRDLMVAAGAGAIVGGAIGGIGQVAGMDPGKLQAIKDGARNKVVNAQVQKQAAINAGKTEAEIASEINADNASFKGFEIFQEMADEVDSMARAEGLIDAEGRDLVENAKQQEGDTTTYERYLKLIEGGRKSPEEFTQPEGIPFDQLTPDQVQKIAESIKVYRDEYGDLDREYYHNDDMPPIELLLATEDYGLLVEQIGYPLDFPIDEGTIIGYFAANPHLLRAAKTRIDRFIADSTPEELDSIVSGVSPLEAKEINRLLGIDMEQFKDKDLLQGFLEAKERIERAAATKKEPGKVIGVDFKAAKNTITQDFNAAPPPESATTTQATDAAMAEPASPGNKYDIPFKDITAWPNVENATSLVFITKIANDMGTKLAVANVLRNQALGNHVPPLNLKKGKIEGSSTINMTRAMFRDPDTLPRVFAHEFAHSVDMAAAIADGIIKEPKIKAGYARHEKLPVFQKFVRIYKDFKKLGLEEEGQAFAAEVDALDMSWAPYTKEKGSDFTTYREKGTEQFANAMASILSEPTMVRENYPTVWRTFKKAVEAHPDIKKLVDLVDRSKTDPTLLYKTFAHLKEEGQTAEAQIVQKTTGERLEAQVAEKKALPKKAYNWFRSAMFGRHTHGLDVVDRLIKQKKITPEQGHEMVTMMQDVTDSYVNLYRNIDEPVKGYMNKLVSSVKGTELEIYKNMANLMDLNHIINDTNSLVDDIKANPDTYKAAISDIADAVVHDAWKTDVANLTGEYLVKALAKIHSKMNPESRRSLQADMMEKGNEAAVSLLDDDAFNVRRLMATYGVDYNSAPLALESFKATVGKADYAHYEQALKDVHSIGHKLIDRTDHAGLVDAKTKDKMIRNVESWAPQNVIKYFEKDGRIPASIRKAIGSWDKTGNALASYVAKVKALTLRAAYQETQNNTMNLIKESGDAYREIEPKRSVGIKKGQPKVYYESLFDRRTLLEKQNPDKSYFITTEEGKLHLWEVDSPEWAKMFGPGQLEAIPGVRVITSLADSLNKIFITHWSKTLGSLPFVYMSKFRDIGREAMLAGSAEVNITNLMGVPMHMGKKRRQVRRESRKESKDMLLKGEVAPLLQEAFDHHGVTWNMSREFGNIDERVSFEHGVYSLYGMDIPGIEDLSRPERINRALLRAIRKIPFIKNIEQMAQIDELTTKLVAYKIAKDELGMGPWQAGRVMRNWAGTPDPTGGGLEMSTVNKLFLFARAHANGTRAFIEMFKDNPQKIGAQYIYRKLIPRMMASSAIMGPIIGAMFGEEEEQVYRRFLDKLPSYTKVSKSIIPLGFLDENNVLHTLGSKINPKEITPDWKSVAVTIPLERELVAMDQLNTPVFNAIENLFANGSVSIKKIVDDTVGAFGTVFGGNMSVGLQTMADVLPLMHGNPQDRFRKQGILASDTAEAGTMAQRFTEYVVWSMHNNYPAMFGRTQKKYSTEPTSFFDHIVKTPQLGAALRSFVTATNYGDLERSKEAQQEKKRIDAELRMHMGENTKAIYNELSKYSGMISRLGAQDWKRSVSRETRNKVHIFNSWKAKAYKHALDDMRDAHSTGDMERVNEIRDKLEQISTRTLKRYIPD